MAARAKSGSAATARRAPGSARGAIAVDGLALIAACERGSFPPTLYIDGSDESLKAALLADLRQLWARAVPDAPAARVMRAAESEPADLLAVYHGSSLFSPRELAIVLDVQDLGRSEKRIVALAAGLARPSGGTTMVLVESAGDNERKSLAPLRAACAVHWTAVRPERDELLRWGTRRLARERIQAAPGVLESVADTCEGDPCAFFNELDKLATFVGPEARLTDTELRQLHRPELDADLPEYLAAVAVGNAPIAAQKLSRLLATGAGEGQILFSLQNLVGGALGGWARHRDLSFTLRNRCGPKELGRALDALYRAEAAWKGGRADVIALLEHVTRIVSAGESSPSRSTRT
jgi:DNA polymerase III delta subunit